MDSKTKSAQQNKNKKSAQQNTYVLWASVRTTRPLQHLAQTLLDLSNMIFYNHYNKSKDIVHQRA